MMLVAAAATVLLARAAHGLRRNPEAAVPAAVDLAAIPAAVPEAPEPVNLTKLALKEAAAKEVPILAKDSFIGCAKLPSLAEEFRTLSDSYIKWSAELTKEGWKGGMKYTELLANASRKKAEEPLYLRQARDLNFSGRLYLSPFSEKSIWNASHQGYEVNKYPLHRALHKFLSGKQFDVAVVGGSFTAADGPACPRTWPARLSQYLTQLRRRMLPDRTHGPVKVQNLARSTTTTRRVLMNWGAEFRGNLTTTDLVLSEYNLNDQMLIDDNGDYGGGAGITVDLSNKMLTYELDSLPHKPGLVLFDLPNPFRGGKEDGEELPISWHTRRVEEAWESSHFDVARTLMIPSVWYIDAVRNSGGLYFDMNFTGINKTVREHPMCFPGQVTLAYTMYLMLLQEMHEVCTNGLPPELPLSYYVEGGQKNVSDLVTCVMHPSFDAPWTEGPSVFNVVNNDTKWEWREDVAYKPGWIAPNGRPAEIVFEIYTVKGIVQVEYLQTYENIGSATCVLEEQRRGGKVTVALGEITMDGKWNRKVSHSNLARLSATVRPAAHNLRCRSDGRKFKITSIIAC